MRIEPYCQTSGVQTHPGPRLLPAYHLTHPWQAALNDGVWSALEEPAVSNSAAANQTNSARNSTIADSGTHSTSSTRKRLLPPYSSQRFAGG